VIQRVIQHTLLNFELHIFKAKWLLPIAGILFFSYITIGRLRAMEANFGLRGNAWDALFAFFGNIYFLLVVLMLPFIYLVSDLTSAAPFEQHILLKLESRREWWAGKVLTLVITALLYAALSTVGVLLIISAAFAWEADWSVLAQAAPPELSLIFTFALTEEMLLNHPLNYLLPTLLAVILGLFLTGLLAQIIALLAKNTFAGFIMGAAYIVGSIYAVNYGLSYPTNSFFIPVHLQPFLYDAITPPISAVYWVIGIGALLALGTVQSQRIDFW
jgi:hypothetical protein